MEKKKTVRMTIAITQRQSEMLKKLSQVSLKPQTVLIREAIDILFKTPGGSK